jgi:hypothetical protein
VNRRERTGPIQHGELPGIAPIRLHAIAGPTRAVVGQSNVSLRRLGKK